MNKSHQDELRCFCARKPLLAVYGVDKKNKPYIHIKVFKQARIYAEVFISADAETKIRCRDCFRLHKITIVSGHPSLREDREIVELIDSQNVNTQVAPNGNVR